MDSKRGLVIFVFVIAFVIFSISFISSTTCDIRLASSCPAVNTVMKLSSQTNAHGASYNGAGNYQYALCCVGMKYYTATDNASMHTCNSDNGNLVLKLSSTTNAHAQTATSTEYSTNICFGKFQCKALSSCNSEYSIQVASLSATTNAHIGQFSAYSTKICCKDNPGAVCGNGIREAGEACDDGNERSGDGCSYPNCAVESGYTCDTGSPSCCYRTNPRYAWFLNGNPFSGGRIGAGDRLKMTIYDDLCLPSGSGPEFRIYEGSSLRATNSSIVSSKTPGGEINSTYPISSSFLNALGSGSSDIFFRTTVNGKTYTGPTISVTPIFCGNGVRENPPEDCDGSDLGGATCRSLLGSGYEGTPGCTSECKYDTSRCCRPETDAQFCTRNHRYCGTYTGTDNCGRTRTANCGQCSDGDPCTTDICNNGVCTYSRINECCNRNSDCGGSTFCPQNYCNLDNHRCSNNYPTCKDGDGCCPPGCNRDTDNDCVCTHNSQCEEKPVDDKCTIDVCSSSGSCSRTQITECKHGDGCCLSKCNSLNDNDCGIRCGNGVRENPPEDCDGSALGGATCASIMGPGYTGPLGCTAPPNGCKYDTSRCVAPCELTRANWNYSTPVGTSIIEGTPVRLNIVGTNCGGKTINFEIFEKDGSFNEDDLVTSTPITTTFPTSGTSASVVWDSVYIPDNDGIGQSDPPEYYFNATVRGSSPLVSITSPNSKVSDDGLLRVSQFVPSTCNLDGRCDGPIENCSNCADCACVSPQTCNSATKKCVNPECELTSASWNETRVIEGTPVRLNVAGTNCDGSVITFEVLEKDPMGTDPITNTAPLPITYSSSNQYSTWLEAEYQDDSSSSGIGNDGNPPEYIFIARSGTKQFTSTNILVVYQKEICAGISLCSQYPEDLCESDICGIANNEDKDVCGTNTYNPSTGCWTMVDCGCSWNSDSKTCGPRQSIKNNCANCGNNVLEGNEVCDGTLLQLRDNSCARFDAYTSGEVKCYGKGEPEECTYDFSDCGPLNPVCGNGVREEGEECDDGNTIDRDECSYPGCKDLKEGAVCGNDNIEVGEVCDGKLLQLKSPECSNFDLYEDNGELVKCYPPGHENECRYDFSDCTPHQCGNGVLEEGEECDDGNMDNYDECSYPDCKLSTKGRPEVGWCNFASQGDEVCGDGKEFITRTLVGTWVFPPENEFTEIPTWGEEIQFIEKIDALGNKIYRYDPERKSEGCEANRDPESIRCPALVQLPFFGIYHVIIALILVALIYLTYHYLTKRKKVVSKNSRKSSKNKRK
ncbi:MAG TPA: hypothetical protein PK255_01300 [Candidatus Pacearchaeota archaeon]|nr:hypothetical protein [Candidatus Pacearchaeota archaeon]HQF82940.1 hypothetical protein [Candidatus Pacearchaeota archaeon]HQI57771.1 hypothetical protein [Candidatus Pacearchaeota archaeon]HQJ57699.1 hypothetical protein [Candidatus Pacearchaeota archaeon]